MLHLDNAEAGAWLCWRTFSTWSSSVKWYCWAPQCSWNTGCHVRREPLIEDSTLGSPPLPFNWFLLGSGPESSRRCRGTKENCLRSRQSSLFAHILFNSRWALLPVALLSLPKHPRVASYWLTFVNRNRARQLTLLKYFCARRHLSWDNTFKFFHLVMICLKYYKRSQMYEK